jgi:putative selenium metabolism protein SsnA
MHMLITGGTVVTMDTPNRVYPGGWILLKGDRIQDVGSPGDVSTRNADLFQGATLRRFLAKGQVVMPGLICAHHHLYSTFARGAPLAAFAPCNFEEILSGLWWKLDKLLRPGDVRLSALPTLLDCLQNGTTTIIDHHESQDYQDGVLSELADACREVGVRSCLTLGASDRYGRGLAGIAENRRFLETLAVQPDEMIRGMVGLHASFTVDDATLGAAVELAQTNKVGIHAHLAEDPLDQEETRRKFGCGVVERLDRAGALNDRTLLAHGIHLDDGERRTIAARKSWVLHNPESNMNNAVGAADLVALRNAGVALALGTDGMSSDMRAQARAAMLLSRHARADPRVGFAQALEMLLVANGKLASQIWGRPMGVLKAGAVADLAFFRYEPPTPITAENFGAHFLFGLTQAPVAATAVGGQMRYNSNQWPGLDREAITSQAQAAATALWQRFSEET